MWSRYNCPNKLGENKINFEKVPTNMAKYRENKYVLALFVDESLGGDDALYPHGAQDGAHDVLALSVLLSDLCAQVPLRDLDVLAQVTVVIHQGEEVVGRDVHQLVVDTLDKWHVHVVSGGADIFVLLAVVQVNAHHVHLGVAVLAGLGGGHLHDLARAPLHDNVAIFT